jgi:hypothetical protein
MFMILWLSVWRVLLELRTGFSRLRTFLWFAVAVMGFCARKDLAGVSSFVRALGLQPIYYDRMRDLFHSSGFKLDVLTVRWAQFVIRGLPICKVNGRGVLIADGIKIPKEGKKMPGVKSLHQESQSNTKPKFIMGHSCQVVAALVGTKDYAVTVPLISRICEGIVRSNRQTKTLLDKLLDMVASLLLTEPYYLVCDAYYASRGMVQGLLKNGNHLVTRVRTNSVAYAQPETPSEKRRGRRRLYGEKIILRKLFKKSDKFTNRQSPIYDDRNITLQYYTLDLLWRPVGHLVRFVLVTHPTRGNIILMSSDLSLSAIDIIKLYAFRFKIEVSFKQARHSLGAYSYHFWTQCMKPIRRGSGNQYLHRASAYYRKMILRKFAAYNNFIQVGVIAQGLLIYLSLTKTAIVWASFGSWLRTIRPRVLPSEQVVMVALRNSLPEFLSDSSQTPILQNFIQQRLDLSRAEGVLLAA